MTSGGAKASSRHSRTGPRRLSFPRGSRRADRQRSLGRTSTLLLVGVVGAVALLRSTVAFPVRVASSSMQPTFSAGDVVLVSRGRPELAGLRRGDVVTFRPPDHGRRALKRVVGLPGDTLVVLDGRLLVDGVAVHEPYVDHALVDGYHSAAFRVPAGRCSSSATTSATLWTPATTAPCPRAFSWVAR